MTHHSSTPKHQSSDKHGSGAGDHQQEVTIYQYGSEDCRGTVGTDQDDDLASDVSERDD